MFKDLDPLLNQQLRLSIMSLLIGLEEAEFTFLKEKTGASSGNLSVQLSKLEDAGYITIEKSFQGNYPRTACKMTKKGQKAFEAYFDALLSYRKGKTKK